MVNINRVAIVGGTHGNEFTGVYLINKFNKIPKLVQRPSFKTQTIIANIWVFNTVKRYIDKDLNRCFATADLQNDSPFYLEEKQAKFLNRLSTPKVIFKLILFWICTVRLLIWVFRSF
ncbi:hypothetical protein [Chlorogloeopsis fritschii]|uniref:hypothetical protein n=1 Tax=Chlorogloeopsis fritschii TaxID=1124 RepID=UPI003C6C28E7